jgi:protein O-mannosyl-transferase
VSTAHTSQSLRTSLKVLGILALGLLIYWPALHAGFIWDDDMFLTLNPLIKASDGLKRFWFTNQAADYWPLTSTSLWLEWRLWGMNPMGYHTTNVLLHLIESLLLWRILYRLNIPGGYLAALLFLVHPLNVESVAWITQRKNTMAMLFFLITCLYFISSEESNERNPFYINKWYYLSLLSFICALLSKGSVILLPVVLLAIIYTKKKIVATDIFKLLPFTISAIVFTFINLWFQNHATHETIRTANFTERLLGAGAVPWFYLSKIIFPHNLSFIYPQWNISTTHYVWWIFLIASLATSIVSLSLLKSKFSFIAYSWLYFCLMLIPVMGFADIYFMKYSLVADHYSHLAIIGIIVLLAYCFESIISRLPKVKPYVQGLILGCILILSLISQHECLKYKSLETLYTTTLKINPNAWFAETNLVVLLSDTGRLDEAIRHGENAITLKPNQPETHYDLGCALSKARRYPEAITQYVLALQLRPNYRDALFNLGNSFHAIGDFKNAVDSFNKVIQLDPKSVEANTNLGACLAHEGRYDDASVVFEKVIMLRSPSVQSFINYGNALANAGKLKKACDVFKRAVDTYPNSAEVHNNYAMALSDADSLREAISEFKKAIQLDPSVLSYHSNLAKALKDFGDIVGSLEEDAIGQGLKRPN